MTISSGLAATRRGNRAVAVATIVVMLATAMLVAGSPAWAVTGSPTVSSTAGGVTSVAPAAGKSQGSGLWGYVGDLKTRSSGMVFNYGIAISPSDGSVWVTDSAKAIYTTNTLVCSLSSGTLYGGICYVGESRVLHYKGVGSDWSIGQYNGNGTYGTVAAGANAGIGANYETLADATVIKGTEAGMTDGQFGGVRGIAIGTDGTAWIADSDAPINVPVLVNTKKSVRIIRADETEGASFGPVCTWAQHLLPGCLSYPVGVARLNTGNFIISSTTADLLQEFQPDGTWVRNILLDRPANTAYAGDAGYRNPNGLAVDPITGDILVNYVKAGAGKQQMIERINAATGALTQTIVSGLPSNTDGFTLAVDPTTGDIYAAMSSGLLYVFASDGIYKGRFSAFGSGSANGQVSTSVRGIAFDSRGFMYLTTGEGTTSARVEIFARTPDAITGATATYACEVDGGGALTGAVDKTQVALTWDALASGVTADAQAPVRDYVIERSTDAGATWAVVPTPTSEVASETLTGQDPAATYQYRLSAWNEAGNGDTAITSVTTPVCAKAAGVLTVSKTVTGATAPSPGVNYAFTVVCTLAGSPVALAAGDEAFLLADAGSRSITVPADAICTVAETSTGTFAATYSDTDASSGGGDTDGVVTVAQAGHASVSVTNTYPDPAPGSLTVTKTVTGASAPAGAQFSFTVACSVAGSPVPMGAGDEAFVLVSGGSRTISGLPDGAECAVAEAPIANFASSFADSDGSTDGTATITSDAVATVAVTNAYTAPPIECVADDGSVGVVYSTQNNANAPLDGSYTVYDRVQVGRSDMKLVYTILKPCVTYPVPVLQYSGDWDVAGTDPDTYATYTVEFGAVDQATADAFAPQLAAMNLAVQTSAECQDKSIANFEACLRPIIVDWGNSIPVGITGTVTASVGAATPGNGQLTFHLEQLQTGQALSPTGVTPYTVTKPTLALAGAGAICSSTLEAYQDATNSYTPSDAVRTELTLTGDAADDGIYPDDETAIGLDPDGVTYEVVGQTFATVDAVRSYLLGQASGDYEVFAHYVAPDAAAANDPAPIVVEVLGASDAECYTVTPLPPKPTATPTPTPTVTPSAAPPPASGLAITGSDLGALVPTIVVALLLTVAGIMLVAVRRRRSKPRA